MLFQTTANYCCFEKGTATMSQPSERQDETPDIQEIFGSVYGDLW